MFCDSQKHFAYFSCEIASFLLILASWLCLGNIFHVIQMRTIILPVMIICRFNKFNAPILFHSWSNLGEKWIFDLLEHGFTKTSHHQENNYLFISIASFAQNDKKLRFSNNTYSNLFAFSAYMHGIRTTRYTVFSSLAIELIKKSYFRRI